MVEIVDLVQIEGSGPPFPRLFQNGLLPDIVGGQFHRTGADGVLGQVGGVVLAEAPVHDGGGVVVEILRHGQGGLFQVELDGVIVDHFDGVGDALLGLAVGAGLDHGAEEAEVRGTGLGIEPAVDRVGNVGGGELVTVGPGHVVPQMKHPGLEIVRCFPTLGEIGNRDVVRPGAGQMLHDESRDIGFLGPVEAGGIGHLLNPHGDSESATGFRGRRGHGWDQGAADEPVGRDIRHARGHPQKRRLPQKVAPGDLPGLQLIT